MSLEKGIPPTLIDLIVEDVMSQNLHLELIPEIRDSNGWVKCSELMPLEVDGSTSWRSVVVLGTNGHTVHECIFNAGNGAGKPWAAWDPINKIPPEQITHWRPMPDLPLL